jgi:flagellar basal-body rod protein FlgF
MYKGFYNLTSGMLTQQRNLNVVGNNLVNVSTAGFKQSRYTASTFDDVVYNMVGNKQKNYQEIGRESYIRANSEVTVDYSQGIPEPTAIPLDFAIVGDGFFAVQGDGGTLYTRSGSFSLDEEGYLCYPGQGRILDPQGQTIYLGTDKIEADNQGNIYTADDAHTLLGQVGLYEFADRATLEHNDEGFFAGAGAQPAQAPYLLWKHLERANTDMIQQMTEMLTCQRALQSAAQVSKMYDELMSKATNDVGRL